MRAAKIADYRRHLRDRGDTWKFQLQRFAFEGIPSLGQAEFSFKSPLTAICGPNGVGKTTLLRAIRAAAFPEGTDDPISVHKLPSGGATLEYQFAGNAKSSTVAFSQGKPAGGTAVDVEVIHLDVASALPSQQQYLCTFDNAADLINGVGDKALDGRDLALVNYLAKRDYREVRIYEVEGRDHDTIPYFEVTLDGSSYDSRAMGGGEFAIFYLWWALIRSPENSLILIEEPECHLSPGSQSALCDFLVWVSIAKARTIVLTTHSSRIVAKLDDDNLIFVYRSEKGIEVVRGQPSPALLETLGVEAMTDTVVFVEDRAGAEFARFLLQAFRPDLARRTEIVDKQGDGNIVNAIRESAGITHIGMIGLFDGDVRLKVPEEVKERAVFLPGEEAIEVIFRKMLEENRDRMKEILNRPDLGEVLFQLKGADHHDWYAGLCRHFGQSQEQLLTTLIRIWLRLDGNEAAARATVEAMVPLYKARR
ncbi:ATP-dependent endonuclease [Reyranella sp. CPCC 100927]|uniref:ATP-dependent nuclease n=1 Tax=Reyranella sp. CPCC 100927 TaxID=2599616 RepID=UPI0011B84302|nr:AAA family ATPase [Reyranella sp. CPCC 100927]TWS99697.1 AAA family ATPase [Reyranella sp. CPCC 100927]